MSKATFQRWAPALLAFVLLLVGGCSRESKAKRALARAEQFYAAGEYNKAEVEYLNVLRSVSSNRVALARLGEIYFTQDQVVRALPFLNGIRQLEPENLPNRARRARVVFAAG